MSRCVCRLSSVSKRIQNCPDYPPAAPARTACTHQSVIWDTLFLFIAWLMDDLPRTRCAYDHHHHHPHQEKRVPGVWDRAKFQSNWTLPSKKRSQICVMSQACGLAPDLFHHARPQTCYFSLNLMPFVTVWNWNLTSSVEIAWGGEGAKG